MHDEITSRRSVLTTITRFTTRDDTRRLVNIPFVCPVQSPMGKGRRIVLINLMLLATAPKGRAGDRVRTNYLTWVEPIRQVFTLSIVGLQIDASFSILRSLPNHLPCVAHQVMFNNMNKY